MISNLANAGRVPLLLSVAALFFFIACDNSEFKGKGFTSSDKSKNSGEGEGHQFNAQSDEYYTHETTVIGGGTIDSEGGNDACPNDGPRSFGDSNPKTLRTLFAQAAQARGISVPNTSSASLLGSDSSSGGGNRWNPGSPHIPTVTEVCRVLGYAKFVSMDCYDSERSSKYRNGKCNYHSEGDNALIYFDGSSWRRNNNISKYGMNWIATIQCDEKICE